MDQTHYVTVNFNFCAVTGSPLPGRTYTYLSRISVNKGDLAVVMTSEGQVKSALVTSDSTLSPNPIATKWIIGTVGFNAWRQAERQRAVRKLEGERAERRAREEARQLLLKRLPFIDCERLRYEDASFSWEWLPGFGTPPLLRAAFRAQGLVFVLEYSEQHTQALGFLRLVQRELEVSLAEVERQLQLNPVVVPSA